MSCLLILNVLSSGIPVNPGGRKWNNLGITFNEREAPYGYQPLEDVTGSTEVAWWICLGGRYRCWKVSFIKQKKAIGTAEKINVRTGSYKYVVPYCRLYSMSYSAGWVCMCVHGTCVKISGHKPNQFWSQSCVFIG